MKKLGMVMCTVIAVALFSASGIANAALPLSIEVSAKTVGVDEAKSMNLSPASTLRARLGTTVAWAGDDKMMQDGTTEQPATPEGHEKMHPENHKDMHNKMHGDGKDSDKSGGMMGDGKSGGMMGDGKSGGMMGDGKSGGMMGDGKSGGMMGDGKSGGMMGDGKSGGMMGDGKSGTPSGNMDMQRMHEKGGMHDQMHKKDGMHDRMHETGLGGGMMSGNKGGMMMDPSSITPEDHKKMHDQMHDKMHGGDKGGGKSGGMMGDGKSGGMMGDGQSGGMMGK